jgi:hypothetical protein
MAPISTADRYRQRAIEVASMAALAFTPRAAFEYSRIATGYMRLAAFADRQSRATSAG